MPRLFRCAAASAASKPKRHWFQYSLRALLLLTLLGAILLKAGFRVVTDEDEAVLPLGHLGIRLTGCRDCHFGGTVLCCLAVGYGDDSVGLH